MRNGTRLGVLAVLAAIGGGAAILAAADDRDPLPDRLSGLINDYTPGTVKNGPYEMRGEWSLDVHGKSGKASFSAVMNMETSDWGASKGIIDPDVPESRGAHTHHITMTNATVTRDPSVGPPLMPPTAGGFVVTGPAHVTGNGSPAPFESNGNPLSTIQLCFTGGSAVELSNFTLVFSGLATGHFGTQAIHGVVTCTWPSRVRSNGLCDDDKPGSHGDDWHPNDHAGGNFH
jgi:hypothetical protein